MGFLVFSPTSPEERYIPPCNILKPFNQMGSHFRDKLSGKFTNIYIEVIFLVKQKIVS